MTLKFPIVDDYPTTWSEDEAEKPKKRKREFPHETVKKDLMRDREREGKTQRHESCVEI